MMGASEMKKIANLIDQALQGRGDEARLAAIAKDVQQLCADFPIYAGERG